MGKKEGQAGHGAAGNEKHVWPGLGCSVRPPTAVGKQGRAGPAAGRAASDFPDGHRKRKNSRKWEAGHTGYFLP